MYKVVKNQYNIPEVLFYYRDHLKNTSHKQKNKMRQAGLSIGEFVRSENPTLYKKLLLKSPCIRRIRLFGLFPFVTTITRGDRTKVYLFGKILLFTNKTVVQLKGK